MKKNITVKALIEVIRTGNKENKAIDYLINDAIEKRTCREKYSFLRSLFARSQSWAFRCKEPLFYVSKTQTVYSGDGNCDGKGDFVFEPHVYTLSEVIHLTKNEIGCFENLQLGPYEQSLYETDGETDYRTGELTLACLHINGTPDALWLLTQVLGKKIQLPEPV